MGEINMAEFESKEVTLNAEQMTVYEFLSDFRNFRPMLEGKVQDLEATADFCSFKAEGAGVVQLRYQTRTPDLIAIEPAMQLPVSGEVSMYVDLKNRSPKTLATIGVKLSIPPMFRMMLSRPVKNVLEMMSSALEKHFNE